MAKHFDVTVGLVTTSYNQTTDYTFDLRSQMTGISISTPEADPNTGDVTCNSESSTNVYNAAGQRVKKVENDETTKYYYTGSATVFTTDQNHNLLTENILDSGGQIIASLRFQDPNVPEPSPYADKYYFYNYDMRGSVTNVIAPDGTLITGYSYDEFGNKTQNGDAGFLNEVTFTGSVSDTSTGLQYLNARYYNPETGRFISQDSYTGNAYDPWTQHLYAYTMNNPTNFVDPTGHSPKPPGMPSSIYEQYEEYQEEQRIKKDLARLQNLIDSGLYDQINQANFKDIPLYGGKFSNRGCGMIAGIIAASLNGVNVNVEDAYEYFKQPGRNFLTGVSMLSVYEYMNNLGLSQKTVGGRFPALPPTNKDVGVYIMSYGWANSNGKNFHWLCFTVDNNGDFTAYNRFGEYSSYEELKEKKMCGSY